MGKVNAVTVWDQRSAVAHVADGGGWRVCDSQQFCGGGSGNDWKLQNLISRVMRTRASWNRMVVSWELDSQRMERNRITDNCMNCFELSNQRWVNPKNIEFLESENFNIFRIRIFGWSNRLKLGKFENCWIFTEIRIFGWTQFCLKGNSSLYTFHPVWVY